jgi:diguanylate cyclase (GGDEF)-like protein
LLSFKNRLLILIVALVALAQGVTVFSVLVYRDSAVRQESARELARALDVVRGQLDARGAQLRGATTVLVADFGFKAAVASGDAATIRSALVNQARRIDASLAAYYDNSGHAVAAASPELQLERVLALPAPDAAVRRDGWTLAVVDGQPVQLVMSELRAPEPIGWVVLGFTLDAGVVRELSRLVDLQVSFVADDSANGGNVAVSTLAGAELDALREQYRSGGAQTHDSVLRLAERDYLTSSSGLPALNGRIGLVLQRPLAEAEAPYREMRAVLLVIAGAALFGAVGIALFAGRGAVRPLRLLVQAARRIEQGQYGVRVRGGSGAEFTRVVHAFNAMQDGIREREARIAHQARHDELTSLPNRLALQEALTTALAQAVPAAVVLLDVLRFRDINTSLGFQAGDRLLQALGAWLQRHVSGVRSVARVGVDQFALILPVDGSAALAAANAAAVELRRGLAIDGVHVTLEIRAGVSAAAGPAMSAEDLLRQADIALVEAKEQGQHAVLFQSKHDAEHRRRVLLVSELRRAIEQDVLRLEYQPLVRMTNRQVGGFEALARWTHAELGPISPAEFVPLAERAGSVADLTRWVLGAAITQLGDWQRRGFAGELSVNLSADDVTDPALPARVLELLQRHRADPRGLLFEVTESAMMREADVAVSVMQQLKRAGVRFAIDDFGTGYSSLAQLQRLPVDELKIDRAFIAGLDADAGKQVIVHSTTELAHSLGLEVVAEGVETPGIWSSLLRAGCDLAQGYLISRPMPAAVAMDWLARQQQTLDRARAEASSQGTVVDLKSRNS